MQDGSPVNPQSFSGSFDRHVRAANLPRCRLHDVRHAYATAALTSGVHLKVVSDRLGHSSISVTSDTYSDVLPQVEQDAADAVAALILGS